MGELARLFLQWIEFLWPLRKVKPFERGLFILLGRWQREVGPGVYPYLAWFMDFYAESMAEGLVGTPRIDLTLKDGSTVTVKASGTVRVMDIRLAVNKVDSYMESAQELLEAVVAEKIAEVEAERLTPEKRGRLLADLKRWVNQEAATYGIEFTKLRFTTFVFSPRFYRVMQDGSGSLW
jgi:regulator of protease activity HflC (stomatin/prohibitin superfamily)